MSSVTPKQRARIWRAVQKRTLGDVEFKKTQADKKKAQRQRRKEALSLAIISQPEPEQKQKQPSAFDELVDHIYKLKSVKAFTQNKTLKKMTIVNYLKTVMRIKDAMHGPDENDKSNINFLKKDQQVIDFIYGDNKWKTPNSKRTQIIAICSILSELPEFANSYKIYVKLLMEKREELSETVSENRISEKEEINYMNWGDVKQILKGVTDSRDRALIALYTLLPPRRVEDISLIIISPAITSPAITSHNTLHISDEEGESNYILYKIYKTAKVYGDQKIDINDIVQIFKQYIKDYNIKPGDFLFATKKQTQYKNFSKYVTSVFKKYVKDKKITVNMLRHSFISNYLSTKRTIKQKKKIAVMMGHSIDTQATYNRLSKEDIARGEIW
jgi:hypothetical protein